MSEELSLWLRPGGRARSGECWVGGVGPEEWGELAMLRAGREAKTQVRGSMRKQGLEGEGRKWSR